MSNARHAPLVGPISPATGGFATGDAINSISYGRDGTLNSCQPGPGTPTSVARLKGFGPCTDVNLNATLQWCRKRPRIAYASAADPFAKYSDVPGVRRPKGATFSLRTIPPLGLRPMLLDTNQDNVTALELSAVSHHRGDLGTCSFGTFIGPSFAGNGATIFVWNQALPPFQPANFVGKSRRPTWDCNRAM